MAWSYIGSWTSADVIVEELNKLGMGSSVTISLNAARNAFVVWASKSERGTFIWSNLGEHDNPEEVANVMDSHDLGPNNAVVSIDANNRYQLWAFVAPPKD